MNNRLLASALLLALSCSAAFAQNENPAELRVLDAAELPQPGAAVPWLVLAALPAASAVGLLVLTRRLVRTPVGAP